MIEKVFSIATSLSIQNVLIIALLIMIAAPSFFAWRFMTDEMFRHEFMSTTRIVDMNVPCLVVIGNISGQGSRMAVASSFLNAGHLEHLVSIRSLAVMGEDEVRPVCAMAQDEGALLAAALIEREAAKLRRGPVGPGGQAGSDREGNAASPYVGRGDEDDMRPAKPTRQRDLPARRDKR
jgi:hypothetical protein